MKRPWLTGAAVTLAALGAAAVAHQDRLRHLPVPVLTGAAEPPAPPSQVAAGARALAQVVAQVPARVTALAAAADGALWIGTLDGGLYRATDAGVTPLLGLAGRERFVCALVAEGDRVIAGTYAGAIAFRSDGTRTAGWLAGEMVEALAIVDGAVLAGTPRGLWALGAGPLGVTGPAGEALRTTALAASEGRLWIGTPSGVYATPLPVRPGRARWHPLVFGSPGADTNVVTALVPAPGGVLAGTDDGGVAWVTDAGVRAFRFSSGHDMVNPGAVLATPSGPLFGTQAGLLGARPEARTFASPRDLRADLSALTIWGDSVVAGTHRGQVLRIAGL